MIPSCCDRHVLREVKMPLPFEMTIEAHWREHRPKMVAELEREGRLREAVEQAAFRTADAESAAIRNGMPPMQAQELFREQLGQLSRISRYYPHRIDPANVATRECPASQDSFDVA
jgi:hypothetical protein